ncbi:unnamed protein product [Phaedon cochleariae]|uniref:BEN domain-containing protein n=1 Tax=Phaedon cochleariae TaxID=80249 RepID=A0A9P0DVQ6_PHACE|nr:unnamed protein product [Phaedon cochleariae]
MSENPKEKESNNTKENDKSVAGCEKDENKDGGLDKMNKLKKKISALEEQNKLLQYLNISLQKDVIELHKDLKKKLISELTIERYPENLMVGQIIGDEVHLGQNIFLKKEIYNSCLVSAKSGAQFVKNIAVSIFGIEILKNSSVTGKMSNRIKKSEARPPLDPNKLKAIKEIYEHYLTKKGENAVSIERNLSKIGLYISSKISDLNRVTRVKAATEKENRDFERKKDSNSVGAEITKGKNSEHEESFDEDKNNIFDAYDGCLDSEDDIYEENDL